ncbi:uncharacterized protein BO96DRAFT_346277 [Aspergillus niger CBS 101883]|uniref:Uncharacterized protein n=2 Tax=Aspergillus niger TaxID=5061 RepID=A2QSY1_ASPNC|nr:uncharacterized protein BO96DRAFT_346277 [Aspergillus niger CBS 101883]XP_059604242.1 hypothetical protein An09g00080 [Aspergillus niger]PYH52866.1 hypothetical protein BO96DRAFT_346277 [Aspergillus niger CBS 101883]CAK45842.1 hypothetical protein An09g00080 [Aspergillus niger]
MGEASAPLLITDHTSCLLATDRSAGHNKQGLAWVSFEKVIPEFERLSPSENGWSRQTGPWSGYAVPPQIHQQERQEAVQMWIKNNLLKVIIHATEGNENLAEGPVGSSWQEYGQDHTGHEMPTIMTHALRNHFLMWKGNNPLSPPGIDS